MSTRRKPIGSNNFMQLFTITECESICPDDIIDTNTRKRTPGILNINRYVADGFQKVCKVVHFTHYLDKPTWAYTKIDKSLMYDTHDSWVYAIVVGQTIVKIGETGRPLGIRESRDYVGYEKQPLRQTTSRLGRYRGGSDTDKYIRGSLVSEVDRGIVSIWAKRCPKIDTTTLVNGQEVPITATIHKSLELYYLDLITSHTGYNPRLNKARS